MRNLVWFRNDLRVYDNPALDAACNPNNEVVAVYIVSESQWDEHNDSVNKISFWFRCLVELEKELKKINIPLIILKSDFYNGSAYDRARASHTANFAAIESRKFVNRQLPSQQEEKLASFSLVIQGLSEDKRGWEFDAVVQSSLGTESTVTWTLS